MYNRENWCYPLENKDETPSLPETSPAPKYHPTPPSYVSSSSADPTDRRSVNYELNILQREVVALRQAIQDQSDRSAEEMDHLFQETRSLRRAMDHQARHRDA